jgi:hypothetical protein
MAAEADYRKARQALRSLKHDSGTGRVEEIKLRLVNEDRYLRFLKDLSLVRGLPFVVATDAGSQPVADIHQHQIEQAKKIAENIAIMKHNEGKRALEEFAEQIRTVAPQLYVQLLCHVHLIYSILSDGILYFVQRTPASLGRFRWRIDQKNEANNVFEDSYLKLSLPLLQTISLNRPMPALVGADYSRFERFRWPPGEGPTYLKDQYGVEDPEGGDRLNLGLLLTEDLEFKDSVDDDGIQIADLLASGIRRCLRGHFSDSKSAALLLGSLMVQRPRRKPPIQLIGFGTGDGLPVNRTAEAAVSLMKSGSRGMLL